MARLGGFSAKQDKLWQLRFVLLQFCRLRERWNHKKKGSLHVLVYIISKLEGAREKALNISMQCEWELYISFFGDSQVLFGMYVWCIQNIYVHISRPFLKLEWLCLFFFFFFLFNSSKPNCLAAFQNLVNCEWQLFPCKCILFEYHRRFNGFLNFYLSLWILRLGNYIQLWSGHDWQQASASKMTVYMYLFSYGCSEVGFAVQQGLLPREVEEAWGKVNSEFKGIVLSKWCSGVITHWYFLVFRELGSCFAWCPMKADFTWIGRSRYYLNWLNVAFALLVVASR